MLVDKAKIYVQSGKGGDGVISFRREAFIPKGGPDGGDGGNGGSVILKAAKSIDTLLDLTGRHHWKAKNGKPGRGKNFTGASADDLIINIPPGTLVYDDDTNQLIVDLDEIGKEKIVAKGGRGGFGNEHFKGPLNQTPRNATPGEPEESKNLRLELKLIADVGLIGKPNAGKSTLLSVITAAQPKIADYPFTTLEPQLGIAQLSGYRRVTFADIPGLIQDASLGTGLGHDFLRHIERTRILVHILEVEPLDNSDPIDNYKVIQRELQNYSPILAAKPQIIALNKMDLLTTENDRQIAVKLIEREIDTTVIPISAVSRLGITQLLETCWTKLAKSE